MDDRQKDKRIDQLTTRIVELTAQLNAARDAFNTILERRTAYPEMVAAGALDKIDDLAGIG